MKIRIEQCPCVPSHIEMGEIGALLAELSPGKVFQSREAFHWVLQRNLLFLARDMDVATDELECHKGKIIGMATLVIIPKLGGLVGQIEEVCVRKEYQGRGIARVLLQELLSEARERKVCHLDLTCHPSREAANALYKSLGFTLRPTTNYRLAFDPA